MNNPPNPYSAPAPVDPPPVIPEGADPQQVRQQYLRHEAAIRSIGLLYYFSGAAMVAFSMAFGIANLLRHSGLARVHFAMLIQLTFAAGAFLLGRGLRVLYRHVRFPVVVITILCYITAVAIIIDNPDMFAIPIGTMGVVVELYILYLLLSPKARVIFSKRYAEIRQQTPTLLGYPPWFVSITGVLVMLAVAYAITVNGILPLFRY